MYHKYAVVQLKMNKAARERYLASNGAVHAMTMDPRAVAVSQPVVATVELVPVAGYAKVSPGKIINCYGA